MAFLGSSSKLSLWVNARSCVRFTFLPKPFHVLWCARTRNSHTYVSSSSHVCGIHQFHLVRSLFENRKWILNRKQVALRPLLPALCWYMQKTLNEVIVVFSCWFFFLSGAVLHVDCMNKSDVWNRWNQMEAFINERLHEELREHSPHFHSFIHNSFLSGSSRDLEVG